MLYIWDIEKIIQQTLAAHSLKINIQFDNELPAPMSYNLSNNTIKFNYLKVNGYIRTIKMKETDENLVKVILYRTLGYYIDFRKSNYDLRTLMYGGEEEKAELKIQIEKNAWEYGRTLVPDHLANSYDEVRKQDNGLLMPL
ncbi:hypothetical protein [Bacillus sp. FJAT-27251]|uniref:hypothetical protein n=1 Tax=Bacillus sp. FJAT-27251 TaxID=1684142 RepID=UPI0006A7B848|nr:hypothetical protein [Bacillus sp. FJAT-27251]